MKVFEHYSVSIPPTILNTRKVCQLPLIYSKFTQSANGKNFIAMKICCLTEPELFQNFTKLVQDFFLLVEASQQVGFAIEPAYQKYIGQIIQSKIQNFLCISVILFG